MNLHSVVSGAISVVNPPVVVSIQRSTGSTQSPTGDGTPVPTYDTPYSVPAQVQPITSRDLLQMNGLNQGGVKKAIYINGAVDGVVRPLLKGGDLVTFPDATVWLVVQVLEGFNLTAGWTKAVLVLQNGG